MLREACTTNPVRISCQNELMVPSYDQQKVTAISNDYFNMNVNVMAHHDLVQVISNRLYYFFIVHAA